MKIQLNSNESVRVSIDGKITMIEYSWLIKPLSDLLSDFKNTDSYFEKLFDLLYKIKQWAEIKRARFALHADALFKTTFYFFCKSRDYEN